MNIYGYIHIPITYDLWVQRTTEKVPRQRIYIEKHCVKIIIIKGTHNTES